MENIYSMTWEDVCVSSTLTLDEKLYLLDFLLTAR